MSRQPPGRSSKAKRYQPSNAELKTAEDLVGHLTPPPDVYKEYRLIAEMFMDLDGSAAWKQQGGVHKGFRMWGSRLFNGLEYLVAFVADEWLAGIAPTCDAICSTALEGQDEWTAGMQAPPIVYVPVSKRRARNRIFVSVVEHEIVHVNQALLGTAPEPPAGREPADLLGFFVRLARAECEANLVQLARWPELFPAAHGVSMEHWCVLRGYSQALEHVLMLGVQMDFPAHASQGFLDGLESQLPDLLRQIGASKDVIPWFQPRLTSHVLIAMDKTLSLMPAAPDHAAFRAAGRWIRPRLEAAGMQLDNKR